MLGRLPWEMESFLRGYTKGLTVPCAFPENFDPFYEAGKVDERTPRQRRKAAAKLCAVELGYIADHEGWLCALIEFVERHDRLPVGREIQGVKAVGGNAKAALDACHGSLLYRSLVDLRKAMNESASREVFGQRVTP
jgi:hypothetical protein